MLRNRFVEEYESSGAPTLPGLLQASLEQDIWAAATRANDPEFFPLYAGQSVGIIRDLPGAADVVNAILDEAREVMTRLRDNR